MKKRFICSICVFSVIFCLTGCMTNRRYTCVLEVTDSTVDMSFESAELAKNKIEETLTSRNDLSIVDYLDVVNENEYDLTCNVTLFDTSYKVEFLSTISSQKRTFIGEIKLKRKGELKEIKDLSKLRKLDVSGIVSKRK